MGCQGCSGADPQEQTRYFTVCRVCELNDEDTTEKPTRHCVTCNAKICYACWDDAGRRLIAFAEDKTEKVVAFAQETAAKIKGAFSKSKKKDFPTDEFRKEDSA